MNTTKHSNTKGLRSTTAPVIMHDFDKFRTAFRQGKKVDFVAEDGSLEIRPAYGLREPEFPLTAQLDTALEFARKYRAALAADNQDESAEWRDELEVLGLHTGFPCVRTLCAGLVGCISAGAN
jgi:hypothetical protein